MTHALVEVEKNIKNAVVNKFLETFENILLKGFFKRWNL